MKGLAKSGVASQIRSAEALAKQEESATRCTMAAPRVERLKAELVSLQAGVLLRDAANDVPYSQQQRERLFLRRQETQARQESARASHLGQFTLTLPPDYVIWSLSATPGSVVEQWQTMLDLADCDRRFVAVELPESEIESIRPGDLASVRLIGSDAWRQGIVRQVQGSAATAGSPLRSLRPRAATSRSKSVCRKTRPRPRATTATSAAWQTCAFSAKHPPSWKP